MKYYYLSISLFLGIKCLNFLSTLWVEMVPIGFTLESWKDKQISGKWVGRNTTNWLGLDSFSSSSSFSSSFFPVGKLLIPDSDIMSNNLGEALFFCWPTQHTTFLYFFLGMPKKYWGKKKSEHLNCREAAACLPEVLECKEATSKVFWDLSTSQMITIIKVSISKTGHQCDGKNCFRKNKVKKKWQPCLFL